MTTETPIVANTPSTDTAQSAAPATETVTTVVTTPATNAAPEQQTSEAKPADAPGDKPADSTEPKTQEKPVVPEKYEFKAPEGQTLAPEVLGKFEGVAKELGLSQEHAQKVVDVMAPQIAAAQKAQFEATKLQWAESAKTDKEFGGEKLAENIAVAEKALTAFGTPELRALLKDTGLQNHPEIIRAFFKAGQKISSGNLVVGGDGATPPAKNLASALYPNQK